MFNSPTTIDDAKFDSIMSGIPKANPSFQSAYERYNTGMKSLPLTPGQKAFANQQKENEAMSEGFNTILGGVPKNIQSEAGAGGQQAGEGFKQVWEGAHSKDIGSGMYNMLSGAGNMIGGGLRTIFSPVGGLIKTAGQIPTPEKNILGRGGSNLGESIQNTYIKPAADLISNIPALQKLTMKYPGIEQDLGNALAIAMSFIGGEKAPEIKSAVEEGAGTAANAVRGVVEPISNKVSDVAGNIKEKVSPTPPVNKLVGQVAQGSAEDVPSFTRGLKSIGDTSKVSKYSDLQNLSDETIKADAKAQNANLAKDSVPRKVQQLATKVGKTFHNYVLDAVQQLKDFYTKINNITKLNEIKSYEAKLNPTTGEGLTLNEVNKIARMHGSDLNAFNANGELASGLTKQAAENTRVGLKNTIKGSIKDPIVKAEFERLDSKMSDTYTVRDLSAKMAEKVNTLEQRLQKPNILQKIGGLLGKYGRKTGVGDFIQKLVGIEKTPGASSLNAVELEARLQSNLSKIDAALKKDDVGFIKDITEMSNQSE